MCSNGIAVENPRENAGLVVDCAVLLEIREELAGDATLNWSERTSIREWKGVEMDGATEPPRVTELKLVDRGLTGEIPVGIGGLANLQVLDLSWNSLVGDSARESEPSLQSADAAACRKSTKRMSAADVAQCGRHRPGRNRSAVLRVSRTGST